MPILSVSLTPELDKFITDEVSSGEFESKGQLIKKALKKFEEDTIIDRVYKASREAKEGKGLSGDLRDILNKMD